MTNGRNFGGKIDAAINELESELREATSQHDRTNKERVNVTRKVAEAFQQIARIHVHALANEELQASDALFEEAFAVIGDREIRQGLLKNQISNATIELKEREDAAATARASRSTAAAVVESIHDKTKAAMSGEQVYLSLLTGAYEAGRKAEIAKQKAVAASDERDAKVNAYESDPIFMYLHNRSYGTSSYSSNAVVRLVDGWLAKLCGYARAGRDYEALLALPEFMANHAEKMAQQHRSAEGRLNVYVRDELLHNGVEPAEKELADKDLKLKAADAAVGFVQSRISQTQDELRELEKWRDPEIVQVITKVSNTFGSESIERMRAIVRETSSPEDDRLLTTIETLRAQLKHLDGQVVEQAGLIRLKKKRLKELREIHSQYRSRYNSSDYSFSGSSGELLTGFLAGSIAGSVLWEGIQSSASYTPPSSSSSSSSSSDGGFGGFGGFSSGGGFGGGGGGFSTGGGF